MPTSNPPAHRENVKGKKIMKKLIAMTLAALMLLTCFVGCQNSNNSVAETIIVGYTIYEPMNYKDASGKLVGFDTELAEKVFGNLGYKVIFQEIDWNQKYTDLNSGTIDCVWNGFTCNTADDDGVLRSEKVDFSYNYMENQQVLVVKKGTVVSKDADLSELMAAVESGSAGESYAKELGLDTKGCVKQTDCLLEVNSGACDVAVLDAQLAKSYCGKGDYSELEIVEGMSSNVEFYAIGFKKGSDLTAKVNEQLEKLAASGYITELAKKYGVENTAVTDFSNQK